MIKESKRTAVKNAKNRLNRLMDRNARPRHINRARAKLGRVMAAAHKRHEAKKRNVPEGLLPSV
jgi:hypothetical protein